MKVTIETMLGFSFTQLSFKFTMLKKKRKRKKKKTALLTKQIHLFLHMYITNKQTKQKKTHKTHRLKKNIKPIGS